MREINHLSIHQWLRSTNLSYRFPIFETSAAALCGTTGIILILSQLWTSHWGNPCCANLAEESSLILLPLKQLSPTFCSLCDESMGSTHQDCAHTTGSPDLPTVRTELVSCRNLTGFTAPWHQAVSSTITKHRWQVKGKNVPNVELETKRQNLLIGEHRKVSPRHGSLASASICYLSSAILEPVDMPAMQLNSGQRLMAWLRLSLLLIRTILTPVTPVERLQMTGFYISINHSCWYTQLQRKQAHCTHGKVAMHLKQIWNAYQEQTKHTLVRQNVCSRGSYRLVSLLVIGRCAQTCLKLRKWVRLPLWVNHRIQKSKWSRGRYVWLIRSDITSTHPVSSLVQDWMGCLHPLP